MDLTSALNYVRVGVAVLGAFTAALWLSLIIWAFRDMRSRSRDIFAQFLAALVVAVLNIPGLIVYLILRPPETLSQAYARSLEEEALLQEIEERSTCPGCSRAAHAEWRVCPFCQTKLKKTCTQCGAQLELNWNVCAICGTAAPGKEAKIEFEAEI
ncbi:MAG: zinc ribbon domain-containing protein [Chloroflexi bacterium]|nr:zinc ribbon domain-containing protein [Chloroflexota bacterium]